MRPRKFGESSPVKQASDPLACVPATSARPASCHPRCPSRIPTESAATNQRATLTSEIASAASRTASGHPMISSPAGIPAERSRARARPGPGRDPRSTATMPPCWPPAPWRAVLWMSGSESVLSLRFHCTNMHKHQVIGERISEKDRMRTLAVLPPEVRDAYLDVTRSHRRLLERLAQR
jgi:hypothetical protein